LASGYLSSDLEVRRRLRLRLPLFFSLYWYCSQKLSSQESQPAHQNGLVHLLGGEVRNVEMFQE